MSSGLAVLLGSLIIGRSATGELTHFGTLGWIAMGCTFVAMALTRRIRSDESAKIKPQAGL